MRVHLASYNCNPWIVCLIFAENLVIVDWSNSSEPCNLCPRGCGVNRYEELGYCGVSANPLVSSVCLHTGEEPVLVGEKGVCNVFFAHCNLRCVYCQNHQISRNTVADPNWLTSVNDVVDAIVPILECGTRMLGFVSPSHQVIQMLQIITGIRQRGFNPTIIYNTNCYDSVDTIKRLDGLVDVYLPDFKYVNNSLGFELSGVSDYFDKALLALREMYRQKGSSLLMGNDGLVDSGLIIRHLVLPGYVDESVELLEYLSEEFSPRLHISLMAQYYPPSGLDLENPLNRVLLPAEYARVLEAMDGIGFRGWVQSLDSSSHYRPDFMADQPFSG